MFAHATASPDGLLHPARAGLHVPTGNLHGELLSVHKINQAYPGVPDQREARGTDKRRWSFPSKEGFVFRVCVVVYLVNGDDESVE